MTHPFLMVWLLLMIRYEFVYVYFIATKNVGDYSYMSSPNIYYRAFFYVYRLSNKLSNFFSFRASNTFPAKIDGIATPTPMEMIIRMAVTPL